MKTLALVVGIFLFSGCAAIFNSESEEVRFTSEPTDARVFVDGKPVGRTPTRADLLAEKTHSIEFKKEGYESTSITLNYHLGVGWLCVDLLGLIWLIVDGATGAWYELDKNDVHAVLYAAR